MFKLIKTEGTARRGEFVTVHGTVQTPAFQNVATCGAIKGGLSAYDLKDIVISSVQRNDISGDNIILIIGKYAAHLSIILEIALIAWICSQGMSDVYMNLQKLQGVFSICTLVVIVDAVLVNILYGRKVSLIVWALLLPFVYPMQRNKYMSGSGGLGTLCCFGFLVAFLAFL